MGTRMKGRAGGSIVLGKRGKPSTETQVDHQEPQEDVFTLLSWNLECLDQAMLKERTEVEMTEVLKESPTVLCFQEVDHTSLAIIRRCLQKEYFDPEEGINADPQAPYFTCMLIKKASGLKVEELMRRPYRCGSLMCRDLLRVVLTDSKRNRVVVATSHLESGLEFMSSRQEQLKEALADIAKLGRERAAALCMLVGDFNIGGSLQEGGMVKATTKDWVDALPSVFTWDSRTNHRVQTMVNGKTSVKCRFDRCYFQMNTAADYSLELAASEARTRDFGGGGVGDLARCDERCAGRATTGANNGWRFLGGSLVGTNFSHGAHPSDHYGLRMRWVHPSGFGRAADSLHAFGGGGGGHLLGGTASDCREGGSEVDTGEGVGQANGRTERLRNILAAKALARMGVSCGGGAAATAAAGNPEEEKEEEERRRIMAMAARVEAEQTAAVLAGGSSRASHQNRNSASCEDGSERATSATRCFTRPTDYRAVGEEEGEEREEKREEEQRKRIMAMAAAVQGREKQNADADAGGVGRRDSGANDSRSVGPQGAQGLGFESRERERERERSGVLDRLVEMGVDRHRAKKALARVDYNLERAVHCLFDGGDGGGDWEELLQQKEEETVHWQRQDQMQQ